MASLPRSWRKTLASAGIGHHILLANSVMVAAHRRSKLSMNVEQHKGHRLRSTEALLSSLFI
jgi:hypothetical protein